MNGRETRVFVRVTAADFAAADGGDNRMSTFTQQPLLDRVTDSITDSIMDEMPDDLSDDVNDGVVRGANRAAREIVAMQRQGPAALAGLAKAFLSDVAQRSAADGACVVCHAELDAEACAEDCTAAALRAVIGTTTDGSRDE